MELVVEILILIGTMQPMTDVGRGSRDFGLLHRNTARALWQLQPPMMINGDVPATAHFLLNIGLNTVRTFIIRSLTFQFFALAFCAIGIGFRSFDTKSAP